MAETLADISLEPTVDLQDIGDFEGSPNSSSDSDETAGVYFGPFQSPEKKLIQVSQHKESCLDTVESSPTGSRLRRSGRFTSPFAENVDIEDANEESDEGGEDTSQSRSGTPNNVGFLRDEPSSVLASRIIRAHGGPSPPPRARPTASFAPSPLKDSLTFPTHDNDSETINLDSDLGRKFRAMFDRPVSPSPQISNDRLPPPSLTVQRVSLSPNATLPPQFPQNDGLQHDLIFFDSSIPSVAPIPLNSAGPFVSTLHTSLEPSGALLSPSPRRATSPFRADLLGTDSLHASPVRRSPRLSAAVRLPASEGQSTDEALPGPPTESFASLVVNDLPQTPHRSPRRSATPQGHKPDPVAPEPTLFPTKHRVERESDELPLRSPPRKKWKGKAKANSSDEDISSAQHVESTDIEDGWVELNAEPRTETETETERARGKRRQIEEKEKRMMTKRELGSLSPDSADVLERLWPIQPNEDVEVPQESETVLPSEQPQVASRSPPPSTCIFPTPTNPLLSSVRRPPVGSPLRVASPSRGNHSIIIGDLMRSPARRVPINQNIPQGSSVQKSGSNPPTGVSVRPPVFAQSLPESRASPAKRVPVTDSKSPSKNAAGTFTRNALSSSRAVSRERSASVEPRPKTMRARSASVERSSHRMFDPPSSAGKPRNTGKLPFPFILSSKDRPMSIPEESEAPVPSARDRAAPVATNSSPLKSTLKQPSTSRIPRMGAKPYARPTARDQETKTPVVSRKVGIVKTPTTKTLKAIKSAHNSGSSSDDPTGGTGNATHIKALSLPSNLKRKRTAEKEKSPPSQGKPVVLIRQVVPGMLGHKTGGSSDPPSSRTHVAGQENSSPIKKGPQPMVMRKVIRQPKEATISSKTDEELEVPAAVDECAIDEPAVNLVKMDEDNPSLIPTHSAVTNDEGSASPTDEMPQPEYSDTLKARSPIDDDEEPEIRVRRTTRARKQAPLSTDVFTVPRPLAPRRKTPAPNRTDDGFAGLTAVALKALTSSNTTRNQQNFVSLATEVVRKDGCRPESPMVKIRTISQREAEEKAKGRSERAHRRARKSEDGLGGDEDVTSDRGDSIALGEDDWEDLSAWDGRHRRGPGDEKEYETPAKSEPPLKRPRFTDEAEGVEEIPEKKRVKWDRGLYSEIYIDEIEINPSNRAKDAAIKKGCLAPNAKALRLDHLGNIINADTPLTDLVHQNIVVKKFVYDNDVEVEVPVVKATRSRSKKS